MGTGSAKAGSTASDPVPAAGAPGFGGFVRRWQWPLWITATVAALAVFQFLVPGGHRPMCPSCEGLHLTAVNLWSDVPPGSAESASVVEEVRLARNRVRSAWPDTVSDPTVIVCSNRDCLERLGAGPRTIGFFSPRHGSVVVGPRWREARDGYGVLAHELVHAEVSARLGQASSGALAPALPAWFEEGLAVVIGSGAFYYGDGWDSESLDRVLELGGEDAWRAETGRSIDEGTKMYGAAAAIIRGASDHAGLRAVAAIPDAVGAGAPFAEAWDSAVGDPPSVFAAEEAQRIERGRREGR